MGSMPMELLAPAGGMEQLRAAVAFGADAVYLAAERFGMRARAANFRMDEIPAAVAFAHEHGVKVHVTCNILMHPDDIDGLPAFFRALDAAGVDAFIIGDLGAFAVAGEVSPRVERHVSTQASVANAAAARVWHSLGASRVVCAREMSLADIARLRQETPPDLEIEAFAHGAMCMAVSGRCLISSYLTGRSGNKGHCTQPCRWSYQLEEEKRPGEFFPIEEDDRGTFIMNAKDLNMLATGVGRCGCGFHQDRGSQQEGLLCGHRGGRLPPGTRRRAARGRGRRASGRIPPSLRHWLLFLRG